MIEQERLLFNPFPGLRSFDTGENYLFFGRDGQSDEVLTKLRASRFVAVVGTSGSGKSSLVRAGLLPALYSGHMTNAGSSWRVAIFRPGNSPISNMAKALSDPHVFGTKDEDGASVRLMNIERTLRRSSLGLLEVISQARMAPHENLLILADQFEELFRFKKKSTGDQPEDESAAFVKLLLETKQPNKSPEDRLSIYVILTMRSDYLGDCAHYWGLPEAINEGQYLIPRMTDDDRREAITGPVIISGAKITAPLVNRLLNDAGDDPAQLPILQHALMRTWDYWKNHSEASAPIDIPHYEQIGGMLKALSNHADEAFLELPPELQKIAEKLFKCLTEKEADNREGRRPATVAELCAVTEANEEQVKTVIESFRREGRSFLMPPPNVVLTADTLIDISHESLISGWERLRKWVNEEAQSARQYMRLASTAVLFPEQQGYLRDPALQIGLNWFEESKPTRAWALRYDPSFDKTIEFLEASKNNREAEIAEKERQQKEKVEQKLNHAKAIAAEQNRRVKQLRWGLFLVSLLLLGMFGLTAYAFAQRGRAKAALKDVEVQRDAAQRAKVEADEQRIKAQLAEGVAVEKGEEAERQRIVAVSAQREAEKQSYAAKRAEAEADKQKRLVEESLKEVKIQRDAAYKAEAAAYAAEKAANDAKKEAEKERDRATKLLATVNEIDQSAPYFKAIMRDHDAEVRSVALSPDAKLLLTTSKKGTTYLYDVDKGNLLLPYANTDPIASATFSHDGNLIATADENGQLGIWDVKTSQKMRMIGSREKRRGVVFSPDDKKVAALTILSSVAQTSPSVIQIWNVSGGDPVTLSGNIAILNSLEFSPDGKSVVATSDDGTARVWETETGRQRLIMRGHLREVNSARFSPDGKFIVTASADGKARVWNAATGESLTELGGHEGKVNSVSFSHNGRYIVTTSRKQAFLWEKKYQDSWSEVSVNSPAILAGHTDEVTNAIFSRDDKWVITISKDRTAQLWRAEIVPGVSAQGSTLPATVASNAVFRGHINSVTSVDVSPDSKYLVTGSEDRTARIWDLTDIGKFRVADPTLKAEPSNYEGECPVTVKLTGTISVSGGSGTVKYKFVRSDNTESLVQELYFDAPGSKQVSETRQVIEKGVSRTGMPLPISGWVKIQIIEPVEMESNQADYKVQCDPTGRVIGKDEEITSRQLKQIMPALTDERANSYLPKLRKAMEEFGINTPLRQAAFLAEVAYNTAELRRLEEAGKDEDLERLYGGRKDLGNFQQGDGARYKGRGAFSLTGRSNYQAYGQLLGVDLVNYPERAASPESAFRTAALLWQRNGLNELADQSDLALIHRRIVGPVMTPNIEQIQKMQLEQVRSYFDAAKAALDIR